MRRIDGKVEAGTRSHDSKATVKNVWQMDLRRV